VEDGTLKTGLVARIVRKWIVEVSGIRVWNGFVWLRTSFHSRFVANSVVNLRDAGFLD